MKKILIWFAAMSGALAIIIYALSYFGVTTGFTNFTWAAYFLMVAIGALSLAIGNSFAKPEKIKHFPNIIMLLIGGKMMASLLFVFAYKTIYEPTGKTFIIPFFVLYAIYTSFMCFGLIKLQKSVKEVSQ